MSQSLRYQVTPSDCNLPKLLGILERSQSLRYQVTPSDQKSVLKRGRKKITVAIPSLSGHSFGYKGADEKQTSWCEKSQSLRYQVTPSDCSIRPYKGAEEQVAIPSLSGHSFGCYQKAAYYKQTKQYCRNPFVIRSLLRIRRGRQKAV